MEQSYKEKYEQALAKAKEQYNYPCMRSCMGILEEIFPELKESEDERVRKWLITQLELKSDVNNPHDLELMILKSIAWLERQGEKHPDPYNGISFEHNGHIWGMCARDNGVDISCDKHLIKHLEKQGKTSPVLSNSSNIGKDEQKPEENKGNIGGISSNWSEEDDKVRTTIINEFEQCSEWCCANGLTKEDCIDWLKSLRPQSKWKPSDEQIMCLSDAIKHYNSWGYPAPKLKELLDDLKKLK